MQIYSNERLNKVEPVQWAIDYLQSCLLLKQEGFDEGLWLRFLQNERLYLQSFYREKLLSAHQISKDITWGEGYQGGRLMVLRLLLNILPRVIPCQRLSKEKFSWKVVDVIGEALSFLKGLEMTPNPQHLEKEVLISCLEYLRKKSKAGNFTKGDTSLLVVSLPYRGKEPGCYLAHLHTIACFCNALLSREEQMQILLHEIGHVIFNKYFHGRAANFFPTKKGAEEKFACKFALKYYQG